MKKQLWIWYAVWVLMISVLYFFCANETTLSLLAAAFAMLAASIIVSLLRYVRNRRRPQVQADSEDRSPLFVTSYEGYRYSDSRPGNDPSVTYGIREYVPGDPVRSIHWKLSEKTGKTMVREFGLPLPEQKEQEPQDSGRDEGRCFGESRQGRIAGVILAAVSLAASLFVLMEVSGTDILFIPALAGCLFIAILQLLPVRRWQRLFVVAAVILVAVFAAPVREGFALVFNSLAEKSEALSRYRYARYVFPEGMNEVLCREMFWIVVAVCEALMLDVSLRVRKLRWMILILPLAVSILKGMFGVYEGTGLETVFFAVLAGLCFVAELLWMRGSEVLPAVKRAAVSFAVGALCFALMETAFSGFSSSVTAEVYRASEQVRDMLEPVDESYVETVRKAPDEQDEYGVRKESLYREEQLGLGQELREGARELEKDVFSEHMIAMPEFTESPSWLKGILMFIAMLLVIVVPLAPFYLLEKKRQAIKASRTGYESDDNAEAVCAMMPQVMECAAGLYDVSAVDYSSIVDEIRESIESTGADEGEYARRLAEALSIWTKAEFAGVLPCDEERMLIEGLLKETEEKLSEKAGLRMRLRYGII